MKIESAAAVLESERDYLDRSVPGQRPALREALSIALWLVKYHAEAERVRKVYADIETTVDNVSSAVKRFDDWALKHPMPGSAK